MASSRRNSRQGFAGSECQKLTSVAAVLVLGLSGCQSGQSKAGVIPSAQFTARDAVTDFRNMMVPEWIKIRPPAGTMLSADETYLRDKAADLAAPADEKVNPWRRPVFTTESGMKLGPLVAPEQEYYVAQSFKWPASEEARVKILLADLNRANARVDDYRVIAERVLDRENDRMDAIRDSDLILSSRRDLENLLGHSIGNRTTIAFALQTIPGRIASYTYAAKRARIDLPGSAEHFNVDAQIARLAHSYSRLKMRIDQLDQQITDVLTQPGSVG